MEDYTPYIWLGIAVCLAVVEGATAQLVSIWFVLGAVAAVVTSFITPNPLIQILVFIIVSAIALIATRPLVKKLTMFKTESTNSDRNIGKTAIVTIEINNQIAQGQVLINGEKWTARTVDDSIVPIDEKVLVEKIEGVKLMVKPAKVTADIS